MAEMRYDLSEGLFALRRLLTGHRRSGIFLDATAVLAIVDQLKHFSFMAQKLEHEIGRYRWNEARAQHLAAEAQPATPVQPAGNVAPFTSPRGRS